MDIKATNSDDRDGSRVKTVSVVLKFLLNKGE